MGIKISPQEKKKAIAISIGISTLVFFSIMFAAYGYFVDLTPPDFAEDGIVLLKKDSFLGSVFFTFNQSKQIPMNSISPEMAETMMSMSGDIYSGSKEMLESSIGQTGLGLLDPFQVKVLSRVTSLILGAPADASIYIGRWLGEKYAGIDYYMEDVILRDILEDFNKNMMGISYAKFFVQIGLFAFLFAVVCGTILKNSIEHKYRQLKKYRKMRPIYKPQIREFTRVSDWFVTGLVLIMAGGAFIGMANHFSRLSVVFTMMIIASLMRISKDNSIIRWEPIKGGRVRTRFIRDMVFGARKMGFVLGCSLGLLGLLYFTQYAPAKGNLYSGIELTAWLGVIYFIIGIIDWKIEKKPIRFFKTSHEMARQQMIKNVKEEAGLKELDIQTKRALENERRKLEHDTAILEINEKKMPIWELEPGAMPKNRAKSENWIDVKKIKKDVDDKWFAEEQKAADKDKGSEIKAESLTVGGTKANARKKLIKKIRKSGRK